MFARSGLCIWMAMILCSLAWTSLAGTDNDWTTTGNAGTVAGVNFVGTTDNVALELKVNSLRALRLEPMATSPNVIGGFNTNSASPGVYGGTVGGGGYAGYPNRVTAIYGTVGGGAGNQAGNRATVAGGASNSASGERSAVGGGSVNIAGGLYATVGGGRSNTASGQYATVAGGSYGLAKAKYGTVSGGGPGDPAHPTTSNNEALDNYATVGGGAGNIAGSDDATPTNALAATVGGGAYNYAQNTYATVGGGVGNLAAGAQFTAAGGMLAYAQGAYATVGGGRNNWAYGDYSTVSGGGSDPGDGNNGWYTNNKATDHYCTVAGGYNNQAGDGGEQAFTAQYATVSGGRQNVSNADSATVGGGWLNQAMAAYSTISGGGAALFIEKGGAKDFWVQNLALDQYCTVGGGGGNVAGSDDLDPLSAVGATVGGGQFNVANHTLATVAGGYNNQATGNYATVAGGYNNQATGNYATIPGGSGNSAQGAYSFAAGRAADSVSDGTFTWADSTGAALANNTADRFVARASGGVYFYTDADATVGVYVDASGTGWDAISDRNAKENFIQVNPTEVLDRVVALPISTWNLKAGDARVRHMGPMAQDLHAAFSLGTSDKAINSVDADGIALAAIQGLHKRIQEQATEIASLKTQVQTLANESAKMTALEERLTALQSLVQTLSRERLASTR